MSFQPNLFLSNIRVKDGLSRPCRYEVILPIPKYVNEYISQSGYEQFMNLPVNIKAMVQDAFGNFGKDEQSISSNASLTRYLGLQCEAASLPGRTLQTHDVKVYGPTFKVPYQSQYGDMNLTFLCTNDFYERKLFERWIECIHPSDTNNLRFPRGETTRYMTNIKVIQYDDFIKQIFAVELIDAYPLGVAPQNLSWGDDGFHRLNVQFAYQKYRVLYEGEYDVIAAAAAMFGSKAVSWFANFGQKVTNGIGSVLGFDKGMRF